MALKLQFNFQSEPANQTIVFDASVREVYDFSADITDFPVESGADVSDNVRAKPKGLQIDGVLSDFPLENEGRTQVSSGAPQNSQRPPAKAGRAKDLLATLERVQSEGVLLHVETGLRVYDNMAISSMRVDRDKSVKNGLRISMTLRTLIIVKTQTALVQKVSEPKAQGKDTKGAKTTETPSPLLEQKKQSLLSDMLDKGRAQLGL